VNVLFAVACILGLDVDFIRDVCKDPSWDAIRDNILVDLTTKIGGYNVSTPRVSTSTEHSLTFVKTFAETNTLADSGIYPAHLPVFTVLSSWLSKAVVAREAAIAYQMEVNKVNIDEV
jgi:hypothetical protein